jgi:hypothetical protein
MSKKKEVILNEKEIYDTPSYKLAQDVVAYAISSLMIQFKLSEQQVKKYLHPMRKLEKEGKLYV